MLRTDSLTGLQLLAKTLAQDTNDRGNAVFVADTRFSVIQTHAFTPFTRMYANSVISLLQRRDEVMCKLKRSCPVWAAPQSNNSGQRPLLVREKPCCLMLR